MRYLYAILIALLLILQFQLWFGAEGLRGVAEMERKVKTERGETDRLQRRNDALAAEVDDLKSGLDAMEERARSELGMIKKDEVFIQVIDPELPPESHVGASAEDGKP